MERDLRRRILLYLSVVFVVEVFSYVFLSSMYAWGIISKFLFLSSFYGAALLFMPFLLAWMFLFLPYALVKKCEKCGSSKVHFVTFEGFVCDECGSSFRFDESKDTKMVIVAVATPTLFLGLSYLAGNILAGERLSVNTIFFSVLLSCWMPSLGAVGIYLWNVIGNSESLKEHRTSVFGAVISITGLLMLIGYGMIIAFLLTGRI